MLYNVMISLAPPMDPRQGVAGHHLASEIPKWGAKLALSGMDKKAVVHIHNGVLLSH